MTGLIDLFRSMNRKVLAAGLGITLLAGAVPLAYAQDGGAPRAHHGRRGHGRRLMEALELSPQQREQLRAIRTEAREAWAQGGHARGERRAVRQRIMQVLTPEQQAELVSMRATHRLERMSERLDLTPAQGQRIATIREQAHQERLGIAQQTQPGSEERRSAMQALRARTQASVRSVLTAEQQQRIEQHRAHRRGR